MVCQDMAKTRQVLVKDPSNPMLRERYDPRTLTALDLMVWQGLGRKQAAETAGLTEHGLYSALRKPHVKRKYTALIEELRVSEKAKCIHALADVRDNSTNDMARVAASKELFRDPEGGDGTNRYQKVPGVVIMIHGRDNADVGREVIEVGGVPKPKPRYGQDALEPPD